MSVDTQNYDGKHRKPAMAVDYTGDEVMIWVANCGGQSFTLAQWKLLVLSEYKRLGMGWS